MLWQWGGLGRLHHAGANMTARSCWSPVPLGPVGYPLRSYGHGGMPLVYLTPTDQPLCPHCANDPNSERGPAVYVGAHESGDPIVCDECGDEIASYYSEVTPKQPKRKA